MNTKKVVVRMLLAVGTVVISTGLFVFWNFLRTEAAIEAFGKKVREIGQTVPVHTVSSLEWENLPLPVMRFLDFVFPDGPIMFDSVQVEMEGQFRRPRHDRFMPTRASQIMASRTPAFVFAAITPIVPGLWARAYDFFAEGKMQMRAKIASTLSVVNEKETPELNMTSLRRWLLESSFCPAAFLPGGAVRWEAIDDTHARAIVSFHGIQASLVASFRSDGSLKSFLAEEDGDLSTPYHGSGEYVIRGDYRLVEGMRIPMSFEIFRVSEGKEFPFWIGRVVSLKFDGKKAYAERSGNSVSELPR